ncbi:Hypothetical protein A7982_00155 [Minicystis rosea]|nr:Hypothetical protein A7982_00155 [Minicystis rosea]
MLKRALGLLGSLTFAAFSALLVGCPAAPPTSPDPAPSAPPAATTPAATAPVASATPTASPAEHAPAPPGSKKSCNTSADCADGELCQGTEGCGAPWTCGPPKPCTRDNVEWCACDGTTFRGSGTCPSKPVRHKGKC